MASIRKRGDLQWEARIRRKGHPVTCKTFNTKGDAERWARDVENEMDRGVFVSRTEAENTTLKEALERFIEEYVPRYKHPDVQRYTARSLQRRKVTTKFLASIRTKDIADFIRERESEGMSGNTIRLDLALLSRLFNVARSSWGMESLTNPVQHAQRPKISKGRVRRLGGDEEERLIEACPVAFRSIVKFALETGMRRGEIASLTWDGINLKRKTAYLPRTKNEDERTVPLSPKAAKILEELDGRSGSVFGVSALYITHTYIKACKKVEIEDLTFHDLRHEAISRLFENADLDVMETKSISGHRSIQILAHYNQPAHRLAERLAGAKRGEREYDLKVRG